MKDVIVANCNKKHVLNCLSKHLRLDGRSFSEFRELKVDFGHDWGCCHVTLGKTRVLAQVSCEIQEPKQSRPNEGILNINVELNQIAAPNFESGRQSEMSVHLNRLLEKCLKDSKAIDLESLCIKLNEKVWAFRVDVNILNHEGNMLDCASIAALAALAHFRRPDITSDGDQFIIHSYEQRDPLPTVVHHYPTCVSYALYNDGSIALADPTFLEETVSESVITYAVNSFKEICSVHLGGNALASQSVIMECATKAANRSIEVVQYIKSELEADGVHRKNKKTDFFENCFKKITMNDATMKIDQITQKKPEEVDEEEEKESSRVYLYGKGSAALLDMKDKEIMNDDDDDDDDDDEIQLVEVKPAMVPVIEISDGENSEEEGKVMLVSEMNTQ